MSVNLRQVVESILCETPVAFHAILAKVCGNANAGLMLSQAMYWTKTKAAQERGGWFYKTARDWYDEICLSRHEQDTAKRLLVSRGFLQIQTKRAGREMTPTLHFRVDLDAVSKAIAEFAEKQQTRLSQDGAGNRQTDVPESGKPEAEKRQPELPESGNSYNKQSLLTTTTGNESGNSASELPGVSQNGSQMPERKPATDDNSQILMAASDGSELPKPERRKQPTAQDLRFPEICDAIRKCWPKGDGYKCDITPADAGAINRALAKFHDWTAEELSICIVARFQSASINPTESVKAWIGAITDYQSGPQDKFKLPRYEAAALDHWRQQARVILYGPQPVQQRLGAQQKQPESDWKRMQREYREQMNS